ncbi:hypothetical protein CK227_10515 [Mesorhizobium sp. WSM4308]|uniref:hypothetical protein n=1 Tax=Mesorhizobium sp. WSM4308 TaxID=2029409 RepID=UPI000BAF0056|nr:hypothetical protein [Mesorhizobium sp. WSM4308]PBB75216.1 hypothetical protein CK227_10515 [Mesorhizobium sp. WSM4308]
MKKGDWFSLPKPWLELREAYRAEVVEKAGEIHTFDGGVLKRSDGVWEVLKPGSANDADVVLNVLRKPN